MQVPQDVEFPAMARLEAQGVSFDRQYCTVPICTPSRATMRTGVHAKETGLWDNTNFAWIHELSSDIPTIGHLLREQGYSSRTSASDGSAMAETVRGRSRWSRPSTWRPSGAIWGGTAWSRAS